MRRWAAAGPALPPPQGLPESPGAEGGCSQRRSDGRSPWPAPGPAPRGRRPRLVPRGAAALLPTPSLGRRQGGAGADERALLTAARRRGRRAARAGSPPHGRRGQSGPLRGREGPGRWASSAAPRAVSACRGALLAAGRHRAMTRAASGSRAEVKRVRRFSPAGAGCARLSGDVGHGEAGGPGRHRAHMHPPPAVCTPRLLAPRIYQRPRCLRPPPFPRGRRVRHAQRRAPLRALAAPWGPAPPPSPGRPPSCSRRRRRRRRRIQRAAALFAQNRPDPDPDPDDPDGDPDEDGAAPGARLENRRVSPPSCTRACWSR